MAVGDAPAISTAMDLAADEGLGMKPGDTLYASCSAVEFEVLAVGKDLNDQDCVTIKVDDINEFIDDDWHMDDEGYTPNLMYVEPKEVVIHDIPWKRIEDGLDGEERVTLRTPGTGCYRCTKLFTVKEKAPAGYAGA